VPVRADRSNAGNRRFRSSPTGSVACPASWRVISCARQAQACGQSAVTQIGQAGRIWYLLGGPGRVRLGLSVRAV